MCGTARRPGQGSVENGRSHMTCSWQRQDEHGNLQSTGLFVYPWPAILKIFDILFCINTMGAIHIDMGREAGGGA